MPRDVLVGFLSATSRHCFGTLQVYDCVATVDCHGLLLNACQGYIRKWRKFEVVGLLGHILPPVTIL